MKIRSLFAAFCAACLVAGCGGAKTGTAAGTQAAAAVTTAEAAETSAAAEETAEAAAAGTAETEAAAKTELPDGTYTAVFTTDSSMFHVNEALNGRGTLTVENGAMTIHVSLASVNIVNLYPGTAEEAEKPGAVLLEPTTDTVTYSDGMTEEVSGFDIPVPALDTEFDLAIFGKKGKWYGHKVSVSDPQPAEEAPGTEKTVAAAALTDGTWTAEVTLTGGSGRTSVESPAKILVKDGTMTAVIVFSSPNYDYVKVGGETYRPVNSSGNSTFEIPVETLDGPIPVTADTTAMSSPHEIDYTLEFHTESLKKAGAETSAPVSHAGAAAGTGETNEKAENTAAGADILRAEYAEQFRVERYSDIADLLTIGGTDRYLVVKEGAAVPEELDPEITVLKKPLKNWYAAATSAMDDLRTIGSLSLVRFVSMKAGEWTIPEVKEALGNGSILYAGKYSAPDYELLLRENCGLALESTMILHTPAVKEKLQRLGIPVLTERSSYEAGPLGRLEWIRLYGYLTDRQEEADRFFHESVETVRPMLDGAPLGRTAAFFSVNANGAVTVRREGDYITKMIEAAGGTYAFPELKTAQGESTSVTLQPEEFFIGAKDADLLIYNSTIEGGLKTLKELTDKNPLFSEFRAVRDGNVWCTGKNMFQETCGTAEIIAELHDMIGGTAEAYELTYFRRLQ